MPSQAAAITSRFIAEKDIDKCKSLVSDMAFLFKCHFLVPNYIIVDCSELDSNMGKEKGTTKKRIDRMIQKYPNLKLRGTTSAAKATYSLTDPSRKRGSDYQIQNNDPDPALVKRRRTEESESAIKTDIDEVTNAVVSVNPGGNDHNGTGDNHVNSTAGNRASGVTEEDMNIVAGVENGEAGIVKGKPDVLETAAFNTVTFEVKITASMNGAGET